MASRLHSVPRLGTPPSTVAKVHPLRPRPVDDAELAAAAVAGVPGSAARIWDAYAGLVRGILGRSLGPSEEVADLVQEVFLRFFRELKRLRDPAAMRSFLIGITLRVLGTELRKRRVRRWLRLTDTGTLPDLPAERSPDSRHALARLYRILDGLDDRGRMAFTLRHFEGYELAEIALAMGCSLATTKRHLARAQERVHAVVKREPIFLPYLQGDAPPAEAPNA